MHGDLLMHKYIYFTNYITRKIKLLTGVYFMDKKKKHKGTIKPNSQNKAEQAITQNPTNPEFNNKSKGKLS